MQIAMEQSARDLNCRAEDFIRQENFIVQSHIGSEARRYYKEPYLAILFLMEIILWLP